MDPRIEEYIRKNRGIYTRDALRQQLIAAGHDPGAVDAALDRMGAGSPAASRPTGWRPRWREFLVLVALGAIGAFFVWAGEMYGAGGIAPVVYVILVSVAWGVAKAVSIAIDSGSSRGAAILLAVLGAGAAVMSLTSGLSIIGLAVAASAALVAGLLFFFGRRNPQTAGAIGAALPIVAWLVVTGTCYAPLVG